MTVNTLHILFRRGKSEHIQDLLQKGEIYINTVDFIRDCDDNEERSDPHDCILERNFLGKVKVKICDVGLDINNNGITLDAEDCVMIKDSTIKGNIYCLSGIYTKELDDEREIIEFKTQSFGESVIVITSPREFIKRVETALKEKGYEDIKYWPVEYFPNDYSGNVGIFKKHEKFKHQNEFRFFISNTDNQPIRLEIGSIEDIAIVRNGCALKLELTDKRTKVILLPK